VHFHFGMSGEFRLVAPSAAPKPTTRLRLESQELGLAAHLSAMTLEFGEGKGLYEEALKTYGPDPLR
jgi:formamidopyrimidine-DNA glycosylase